MIEKMQKQGRGIGQLDEYKPWLSVRDIKSQGFVHRIRGWKTKRVHHLFSNIELSFFYTLEWAINVQDIRERYPLLPLYRTLEISNRFSMNHPMDRSNYESIVMTTDFLVDTISGENKKLVAYSVMPSRRISSRRVLQKTFIERMFWKEQGVDFFVITDKEFNENLIQNVEWLHDAKDISYSPGITIEELYQLEPKLFEKVTMKDKTLASACEQVDSIYGYKSGVSLWVVRHLIANRLWLVNMNKKILPTKYIEIERSPKLINMYMKELNSYNVSS